MNAKNIFVILALMIVLGIGGTIMFILNPKSDQINRLQSKLDITTSKFENATHAKNEVAHVREKLQQTNDQLANIRAHFIRRENLRDVTDALKVQTRKYNLSFDEFTPIFKAYLQDKSKGPMKALPFSISITGNYFKIGKFLDSWKAMPFFIFPDEIYLTKMEKRSDRLKANISGRLYAWAKEK